MSQKIEFIGFRMARLIVILPIYLYRLCLSPYIPTSCRFKPTCSGYALDAIKQHGVLKGGALTFKRIARCHPWGGHGYDPVPVPHQDER